MSIPALFLGWIGSLSVFISIGYIFYFLNIKKAIIVGVIGCTLHGIIIGNIIVTIANEEIPSAYLTSIKIYIFLGLIFLMLLYSIFAALFVFSSGQNVNEEMVIKKTIIDLGTKFTRLEVKEIAEKCKVDKNSITNVVKNMIENQEIYAEYFKSTKSVSFNQQANIDEIDKLMEAYKDWEKEKVLKRS